MEITKQIKDKVAECLLSEVLKKNVSQAEFAKIVSLRHGIKFNKAVLPQLKSARYRNYAVIKDSSWLVLARYYGCMGEDNSWETVKTRAFLSVQANLKKCQEYGVWQVLCDRAGIGKSYAAKEYERENYNVIYVDCSEYPGKSDFVKHVAGMFGLAKTGSIDRLWQQVTDEILLLEKPLFIIDEFGDCAEGIISLMKGLYNKANMGKNMGIGCYFIGADNLQMRLEEGRRTKKRSYAELWSRFNGRITRLNYDKNQKLFEQELRTEIAAIVEANLPEELADQKEGIVEKCLVTNGVRAIRNEIAIQKMVMEKKKQMTIEK